MRGIYVAPGVVGRIIALSRQPINGIIERPDIPGVPPKPENFRSWHSSILHHLIECVRRHANVGRRHLAADKSRGEAWRECGLARRYYAGEVRCVLGVSDP